MMKKFCRDLIQPCRCGFWLHSDLHTEQLPLRNEDHPDNFHANYGIPFGFCLPIQILLSIWAITVS